MAKCGSVFNTNRLAKIMAKIRNKIETASLN
jgi:hypothetical protein